MFPEYRELITRLKGTDRHFTRLFDKHNELDQEIMKREAGSPPSTRFEIEQLKKQKLAIKDELYEFLKKVDTDGTGANP